MGCTLSNAESTKHGAAVKKLELRNKDGVLGKLQALGTLSPRFILFLPVP